MNMDMDMDKQAGEAGAERLEISYIRRVHWSRTGRAVDAHV